MKLENATVFITGANRGLGLALARYARAFAAFESHGSEVAIDEPTRRIKAGLSNTPGIDADFAR